MTRNVIFKNGELHTYPSGKNYDDPECVAFRAEWEELSKEGEWVCSVTWDVTKANKPSAINLPTKITNKGDPEYQFNSGWYSDWMVVTKTKEECMEAFMLVCEYLYLKREQVLSAEVQKFTAQHESFMNRQKSKLKKL